MKSFKQFVEQKINEEETGYTPLAPKTNIDKQGTSANKAIADLIQFKLGDKLLYEDQPIKIESISVNTTDSNHKNISKQFNSVKDAADFIDQNEFWQGGLEVYFGHNPIYLINIQNDGKITRNRMADYLKTVIKPMPEDTIPLAVQKWKKFGESTEK